MIRLPASCSHELKLEGLSLDASVQHALRALPLKNPIYHLISFLSFMGCEVQNSQDLTLRVFQFFSY